MGGVITPLSTPLIGHTRLTHGYLMSPGNEPPRFQPCNDTVLTVFEEDFKVSLKEIINSQYMVVIKFLQDSQLRHIITIFIFYNVTL